MHTLLNCPEINLDTRYDGSYPMEEYCTQSYQFWQYCAPITKESAYALLGQKESNPVLNEFLNKAYIIYAVNSHSAWAVYKHDFDFWIIKTLDYSRWLKNRPGKKDPMERGLRE